MSYTKASALPTPASAQPSIWRALFWPCLAAFILNIGAFLPAPTLATSLSAAPNICLRQPLALPPPNWQDFAICGLVDMHAQAANPSIEVTGSLKATNARLEDQLDMTRSFLATSAADSAFLRNLVDSLYAKLQSSHTDMQALVTQATADRASLEEARIAVLVAEEEVEIWQRKNALLLEGAKDILAVKEQLQKTHAAFIDVRNANLQLRENLAMAANQYNNPLLYTAAFFAVLLVAVVLHRLTVETSYLRQALLWYMSATSNLDFVAVYNEINDIELPSTPVASSISYSPRRLSRTSSMADVFDSADVSPLQLSTSRKHRSPSTSSASSFGVADISIELQQLQSGIESIFEATKDIQFELISNTGSLSGFGSSFSTIDHLIDDLQSPLEFVSTIRAVLKEHHGANYALYQALLREQGRKC